MYASNVFDNFKKNITETIPRIFINSSEKSKFLKAAFDATFWDFYFGISPKKVFYYEDFANYIGSNMFDTNHEFDKYIEAVSRAIGAVGNIVSPGGYKPYEYIETALLQLDVSGPFIKDNLIYYTHSPFLLFFILRNWKSLPKPSSYGWYDIRNGIIPLVEELTKYYGKTDRDNIFATDYIFNQLFGVNYFALLLENMNDLMTIDEGKNKAIISIARLLKFLPSYSLQELFFNKFKEGLTSVINDNKWLYEFLLFFGMDVLLFFFYHNLNHAITFNHDLTCNVKTVTSEISDKISEPSLGISYKNLCEVKQFLLDEMIFSRIKKRSLSTLNLLEEKTKKNRRPTDGEVLLSNYYLCFSSPYYQITKNRRLSADEYEKKSHEYLENCLRQIKPSK